MMANESVCGQPRHGIPGGRLTKIVGIGICVVSMLVTGAGGRPAEASLGGLTASVAGDAQRLGAVTNSGATAAVQGSSIPQPAVKTYVLRTSTGDKYTYSEFTTGENLRVREFVRPDGKVFGLAWQGPRSPDLHVLLGSYFGGWRDAVANQSHISLHRSVIQTSSVVVEMGGPMGFVVGRAWAPALVPAGVDARNVVQ
jgi:Protein of unknown function (DUF2844)